MSSVRFVFPKPRLAELLNTPGGLPVAEAVQRAQANLESLRPSCTAELQALLELCEVGHGSLGDEFDDDGLEGLYAIAVKGIGTGEVCGAPSVDGALTSLCDLLDHLRTLKRYDAEAVGVHIRAWRLLLAAGLPKAGADEVVGGLLKVSGRYAAQARAEAEAA